MDTCLARLFHPAMEGGHLASAQDRAEAKNQLAHDSEARAMGKFTLPLYLKILGWLATSIMAVAAAGMLLTSGKNTRYGSSASPIIHTYRIRMPRRIWGPTVARHAHGA
jgi:hypothetical protein